MPIISHTICHSIYKFTRSQSLKSKIECFANADLTTGEQYKSSASMPGVAHSRKTESIRSSIEVHLWKLIQSQLHHSTAGQGLKHLDRTPSFGETAEPGRAEAPCGKQASAIWTKLQDEDMLQGHDEDVLWYNDDEGRMQILEDDFLFEELTGSSFKQSSGYEDEKAATEDVPIDSMDSQGSANGRAIPLVAEDDALKGDSGDPLHSGLFQRLLDSSLFPPGDKAMIGQCCARKNMAEKVSSKHAVFNELTDDDMLEGI